MLCRRPVAGGRGQVDERHALEHQSLPGGGRHRGPLDLGHAEPLEHRRIDGPGVGGGVGRETEPHEELRRVERALGDDHELPGRVRDPDTGERARELVLPRDVEGEFGAPLAKAGLPAAPGPAEVGPGREEMPFSRDRRRVEERDQRLGIPTEFPELPDEFGGGWSALGGAAGPRGPQRAFLGAGEGRQGGLTPAGRRGTLRGSAAGACSSPAFPARSSRWA